MKYGIGYDTGKKRQLNEDSFEVIKTEYCDVFVIADGMGGENAGEVASKMTVSEIIDEIRKLHDFASFNDSESVINFMKNLIYDVNKEVFIESKTNKSHKGMGTTLVLCFVLNDFLYYAHIGDSRLYGIKNGKIKQLTVDHSYVQELVNMGQLTPEEAISHPQKNIITRAVGVDMYVYADINYNNCNDFDAYLMCTDGFSNMVSTSEIENILSEYDYKKKTSDYNAICTKFVEKANNNGGYDNITTILFSTQTDD